MKKTKRLRAYTIIPSELYVRRAADEQLKSVVNNMGRPGYVLVARQMGKTNLLLNAKRELGKDNDVFLYVDLSNSFPNLEQFFRNIVDIAIDAHEEHFGQVRGQIYASRAEKRDLPAHKEHEQELRTLLNAIAGKVVICLDEIDALTKSDYSDSVFSLIRSTYFASRINFSEFNRLTYILSGVAEPNEIIKNKNISPFNIGEKIYLDDFTYGEFLQFIEKSELTLDQPCIERIFYWTSGNPRMCWDLCSALEDRIINDDMISTDIIDKTVHRLYLNEFDLAPVDHIRQLVEDDREIRNAVMSIHYKKFASISDAQRTKLYLSGIIKSGFSSNTIVIKNRIIEETVKEEWVNYIESANLSLLEQAERKRRDQNYSEALALYKSYEENTATTKDLPLLFHSMGECCLHLFDYKGAVDYLNRKPFKKTEVAPLYFTQNLWLGISYYRLGNVDESISCFEKIVKSDFPDGYPITYFQALVNLSAAYFLRFDEYQDQILEINKQVIDNQAQVLLATDDESISSEVICAAYNNLAVATRKNERLEEAASIWKDAINVARPSAKPKLIVELLNVIPKPQKREFLHAAAQLIGNKDISLRSDSSYELFNFNVSVFAQLIAHAFDLGEEKIKQAFLNQLQDHDDVTIWKILQLAGFYAAENENFGIAVDVFKIAISSVARDKVSGEERNMVLQFALLFSVNTPGGLTDIENEYLRSFIDSSDGKVAEADIRIIFTIIDRHLDKNRIAQARQLFNVVQDKRARLTITNTDAAELNSSFIAIDYLELRLLIAERKTDQIKEKALFIKSKLTDNFKPGTWFSENMLSSIKADVNFVLEDFTLRQPIRNIQKKYGRNEVIKVKYKNGTVKSGKYKHFLVDLSSGNCSLIH